MSAILLREVAKTFKVSLHKDFIIDRKLLIKKAEEDLTPLDFIEIKENPVSEYHGDAPGLKKTYCSDMTVAFLLCYAHRVATASVVPNEQYVQALVTQGLNMATAYIPLQ